MTRKPRSRAVIGRNTRLRGLSRQVIRDTAGFGLPVVIVLLVVLSIIGAASYLTTLNEWKAGQMAVSTARAEAAAEGGLASAIDGWDETAYDTLLDSPGDSVVSGWTALDNGARYRTLIRRVDGGMGAEFYSVVSEGRAGPELIAARRAVGAVMTRLPGSKIEAILVGGDLNVPGNPDLQASPCQKVHANGDITIGGSATADVSATGTVTGKVYECSTWTDEDGDGTAETCSGTTETSGESGAPYVAVPNIDPMSLCAGSDYFFRNGWIVDAATADSGLALPPGNAAYLGWNYDATTATYSTASPTPAGGKLCVDGNVDISSKVGLKTSPYPMTVLSAGSIRATSNPIITAVNGDHLLIAAGDLAFKGKATLGEEWFIGMTYAGSQCSMEGTPKLFGRLICSDKPNPPGSQDWATSNEIVGNAMVSYEDCTTATGSPSGPAELLWTRGWRAY